MMNVTIDDQAGVETFRVAVMQVTPSFLEPEATLSKVDQLLSGLENQGCRLVLLPESVIPGYPRGFDFGTVVGNRSTAGRDLWYRYHAQCPRQGGAIAAALGDLAARYQLYLVAGVTESDARNKTLYCSMWYFDPQGRHIHTHRKIKPTAAERIIWGEGDGSGLYTLPTPLGRIGGLICWENYIPQARLKLYQDGIDIYLAPTADAREVWSASMQHIAVESRSYVLSCNQFFLPNHYPEDLRQLLGQEPHLAHCRGGSCIVDPYGRLLAGPVYDSEAVLVATIDRADIIKSRMDLDVTGHYSRNDIFGEANATAGTA